MVDFLTRDLRGELGDFLCERADFADVALRDGAEDAVFVDEFSLRRGDGEMRMVLTQRQRGIQITDNDHAIPAASGRAARTAHPARA